jgi:hypothetical protein
MPDSTGASPVCRSRRGAGSSRSAGRGPKAMGSKRSGYRDEGLTRRVIFPVRIAFSSFRRSAPDTFSNIGLVLSATAWIRRRM